MAQQESGHADKLIAGMIASAPVATLMQSDQTIYCLVEIWCDKVAPERIAQYLEKKCADGTLSHYEAKPLRQYADNPNSSAIFGFVMKKDELEKLGIDLHNRERTKGHIPS